MSMSINVDIEFSKRYKDIMGAKYDEIADEVLTRTIVEADAICQREAPVDTGTLRRSIGILHPDFCRVCLTAAVKFWRYVQYGTSAHTIRHRARKVNHPGTKANPFLTRTVKKIKANKLFERNLEEILRMKGIL